MPITTTYTTPKVVGKVVALTGADSFIMAVVNSDVLSTSADLSVFSIAGATTSVGNIIELEPEPFYNTTVAGYKSAIISYQTTLRNDVSNLAYPAAGLHYFRDTLYAVAPPLTLVVYGAVDVVSPYEEDAFTLTITANNLIGNSVNSAKATVVATSTGTDSNGFYYHLLTIIPFTGDYEDWVLATVLDNTATITGATYSGGLGVGIIDGVAAGGSFVNTAITSATADTTYGILWRSKTEQQLVDEDANLYNTGWYPITPGYTINFTGGTSEFVKLERSADAVPAATTYYITDGACVLSCEVVSFYLASGTFAGSNAAGTLQIRNLTLVSGTLDPDVDATWDIHSANPPGGGNKIGDLSSDIAYNTLPLIPELVEANTRYEFITQNFYAADSWDAMYGVNGVGRAFYYDGDLFAKIFTQADATLDMPRHISAHNLHLALGFDTGSVQVSVGGEPHNFSGVDGASEHGVGDSVTGLTSLNGQALGIFCEKSIHALNGTTVDSFNLSTLAPNTGCLEYTLVDMGIPIYCNSSGIMTLEQSEKYGDFVGSPLSLQVNPWLRKRLRRVSGRYFKQPAVIGAMPVRTKNQYRLYFRDGNILTMTMQDGTPKFTMQEFNLSDATLVPFAWSSETDASGQEFMHFSYYDPKTSNYSTYVYQWDEGWGMAGDPIEHHFETNWFFGDSPDQFVGIAKMRLYGTTHGTASLKVQASGMQNQLVSEYHDKIETINLPNTDEMFTEDAVPRASKPASLANRGLAVQLKISNTDLTATEPSHTCQVLVLGTRLGGAFDV